MHNATMQHVNALNSELHVANFLKMNKQNFSPSLQSKATKTSERLQKLRVNCLSKFEY